MLKKLYASWPVYLLMVSVLIITLLSADYLYETLWKSRIPSGLVPAGMLAFATSTWMRGRIGIQPMGTKGTTRAGIMGACSLLFMALGWRFGAVEIAHNIAARFPEYAPNDPFVQTAARQYIYDHSLEGPFRMLIELLNEYTGISSAILDDDENLAARRFVIEDVPMRFRLFSWALTAQTGAIILMPLTFIRSLGFAAFPISRKMG